MKKSVLIIAATITMGLFSGSLFAQTPTKDTTKRDTTKKPTSAVTNAIAKPDTTTKNLLATLANVAEESTFAAALKTARIDSLLTGAGPFTVLAPNNDDFNSLSKTRLDSLMKDPVKLSLTLKAHIIAGRYDKAALIKALTDGKGKATLKTIDGQVLGLSVINKKLAITDAQGTVVEVTSFDTPSTNGVIHGINGVLMYK